ncbi:uncharacterized protein AMSG_02776 [Thecamonas trahens ATCC 50062]|uniref:Uncharacterized protein n=1 Tax=Thecamonas trahens ATCC 50062 TaxID=461836 RepID=A0A0L0D1T8_THETB|nr:hypothetical protein AMSG_02776 [Thecamonas trahens ATCC 50062]KNC46324.1 hypothetical protein AMSG_02776 [Thecamonas trahens ATCC 50062]|eukprot:XP_013760617.1 hypothetical protein AMSG_02776 [Thecamonas trahens ATCC 50062]
MNLDAVRVLVVPLGGLSRTKFKRYLELLRAHSEVELDALASTPTPRSQGEAPRLLTASPRPKSVSRTSKSKRPSLKSFKSSTKASTKASAKSSAKSSTKSHRRSDSRASAAGDSSDSDSGAPDIVVAPEVSDTGPIFAYRAVSVTPRIRFEFVADAGPESPVAELHMHKRVLGVVGVGACSELLGDAAYTRLTAEAAAYPFALQTRAYAFDPPLDYRDDDDRFVVIPSNRVDFYVDRLLADFGEALVTSFEVSLAHLRDSPAPIVAPALGRDPESASKLRKLKPGRLAKIIGDCALLAGSPLDGAAYHKRAIDLTAAASDELWLAGAQEGYAAALVLASQHGLASDTDVDCDIAATYREAIDHYAAAKLRSLEVEARLKLGLFYASTGDTLAAGACMMDAHARFQDAKASAEVHDRILLFNTMAQVFLSIGYARKAAFFLRQAALEQADQGAPGTGTALLALAAPVFGLSLSQINSDALLPGWSLATQQSDPSLPAAAPNAVVVPFAASARLSWPYLQVLVIKDLIELGARLPDQTATLKYMAYLLARMHPFLDERSQREFCKRLALLASSLGSVPLISTPGLPYVNLITPLQLSSEFQVHTVKAAGSAASPFIFSSFGASSSSSSRPGARFAHGDEPPVFELGCPVHFALLVSNPLLVPLHLEHITVLVDGIEFVTEAASTVLPPETTDYCVTLTGVPLAEGTFTITGVSMHVLNMASSFGVDAHGVGKVLAGATHAVKSKKKTATAYVVAPPLPRLKLTSNGVSETSLLVHEGELSIVSLTLENVSSVAVTKLDISVPRNPSSMASMRAKASEVILWNDDDIASFLPLEPGAVATLDLRVFGVLGDIHSGVHLTYAAPHKPDLASYYRTLVFDIHVLAERGLQALSFDILPVHLALDAPLVSDEQVAPGAAAEVDDLARHAHDDGVLELSALFPASTESHDDHPSHDVLLVFAVANRTSGTFHLSVGVAHDHVSQLRTATDPRDVFAPVHCIALNQLLEEQAAARDGVPDRFVTRVVSIEPTTVERIAVPIPRFALAQALLDTPIRRLFPAWSKTQSALKTKPSKADDVRMQHLMYYKLALLKLVRLRWFSSFNTSGILPLDALVLTPSMVATLTPDPVSLSLSFDAFGHDASAPNSSGSFVLVAPHALGSITLRFRNAGADPVSLSVRIVLAQQVASRLASTADAATGVPNVVIDGMLAFDTGPMMPGTSFTHSLAAAFTADGEAYDLIVYAQHTKPTPSSSAGSAINEAVTIVVSSACDERELLPLRRPRTGSNASSVGPRS